MNKVTRHPLGALCAALLLAAALAPACSLPIPAAQQRGERHYYVLDPAREAKTASTPAAQGGKTVLKIRQFTVSPGFESREFVYKVGDQRFESDYYNLLFMQPGPALTQATRAWLTASGLFGNVIEATSQVEETHALEGNLVALYGDYTTGKPQAVVEIQFFLLRETKGNYAVAFQKNYRVQIPLDNGTPPDLASGLQKGLGAILAGLESDLRGVK
jgi:cholesterol transport system auxiliary component